MAVEIISKMKPKNNQPFALLDAQDVEMPDGSRLSDAEFGGAAGVVFEPGGDMALLSSGIRQTWRAAAYGKNKFVAVSTDGRIAHSADGLTWIEAETPGAGNKFYAVVYGGGKFIVAGSKSSDRPDAVSLLYSTDGITWLTANDTPLNADGYMAAAYGDGLFVAFNPSRSGAYSRDGVNWFEAKLPKLYNNATWDGVAYGAGRFVAVSSGSTTAAYNEDGENWRAFDLPEANSGYAAIAYGAGRFVAYGLHTNTDTQSIGARIVYSTDGETWESTKLSTALDTSEGCALVYGEDKFVLVLRDYYTGGRVAHSVDGVTWERVGSLGGGVYSRSIFLAYGDGKYIAAGDRRAADYSTEEPVSLISYDGITWQDWVSPHLTQGREDITEQLLGLLGAVGPAAPTSIDLSAFATEGKIVESYADGTSKTTTLEFDELGNPVKITDGDGNVTEIVW